MLQDGRDDNDDRQQPTPDGVEPGWLDRHLVKILVVVGILCCLGLVGRAMTGMAA